MVNWAKLIISIIGVNCFDFFEYYKRAVNKIYYLYSQSYGCQCWLQSLELYWLFFYKNIYCVFSLQSQFLYINYYYTAFPMKRVCEIFYIGFLFIKNIFFYFWCIQNHRELWHVIQRNTKLQIDIKNDTWYTLVLRNWHHIGSDGPKLEHLNRNEIEYGKM